MTWEPRPLPEITPETKPFWTAAAEERLLISECDQCGLRFFYPRALCPDCFGDVSLVEVEGTGEIYTFTILEHLEGWPDEEIPGVVAYVELNAGPKIITNIVDCNPSTLSIGIPVEVTFVPSGLDDIAIPVFTPTTGDR